MSSRKRTSSYEDDGDDDVKIQSVKKQQMSDESKILQAGYTEAETVNDFVYPSVIVPTYEVFCRNVISQFTKDFTSCHTQLKENEMIRNDGLLMPYQIMSFETLYGHLNGELQTGLKYLLPVCGVVPTLFSTVHDILKLVTEFTKQNRTEIETRLSLSHNLKRTSKDDDRHSLRGNGKQIGFAIAALVQKFQHHWSLFIQTVRQNRRTEDLRAHMADTYLSDEQCWQDVPWVDIESHALLQSLPLGQRGEIKKQFPMFTSSFWKSLYGDIPHHAVSNLSNEDVQKHSRQMTLVTTQYMFRSILRAWSDSMNILTRSLADTWYNNIAMMRDSVKIKLITSFHKTMHSRYFTNVLNNAHKEATQHIMNYINDVKSATPSSSSSSGVFDVMCNETGHKLELDESKGENKIDHKTISDADCYVALRGLFNRCIIDDGEIKQSIAELVKSDEFVFTTWIHRDRKQQIEQCFQAMQTAHSDNDVIHKIHTYLTRIWLLTMQRKENVKRIMATFRQHHGNTQAVEKVLGELTIEEDGIKPFMDRLSSLVKSELTVDRQFLPFWTAAGETLQLLDEYKQSPYDDEKSDIDDKKHDEEQAKLPIDHVDSQKLIQLCCPREEEEEGGKMDPIIVPCTLLEIISHVEDHTNKIHEMGEFLYCYLAQHQIADFVKRKQQYKDSLQLIQSTKSFSASNVLDLIRCRVLYQMYVDFRSDLYSIKK